jgi:hypothetical protein
MKSLARLKDNRRLLIITSVAVLLLAVSGYIWWGNTTWASYHTAYGEQKAQTKAKIDEALKLPATNTKERIDKLEHLVGAASGEGLDCGVSGMVSWQQSINGTYKVWQQECAATQASVASFNNQLVTISEYAKSEHALAATLSTALGSTNGKVTEGGFSAVLNKWKTAATAVKGMNVSKEFTPVKTKAQKAVDGVVSVWQALVAAHTAKNEANYTKAMKALPAAYSAMDDIEKESVKQLVGLSTTLQTRYEAAF